MGVKWYLMVSGMHLESKTRRRGMQGSDLQSISNLYSRILEKGMSDDVVDAVFMMQTAGH